MKLALWSFTLFIFFVGILSGVNYLDAHSAHYVNCVRDQASKAEDLYLSERDREQLIEQLNSAEPAKSLNGKTCPPLLEVHKAEIKTRLVQNTTPNT